MKTWKHRSMGTRLLVLALATLMVSHFLVADLANAGERKFLVILASSAKEYPGEARSPRNQPTGGLINKQLIHNYYFDQTSPDIGSFAEYWEEISYGDVTIEGTVTDWLILPWAIQPALVDPNADDPNNGPPEEAERNSPVSFIDLDGNGQYGYGSSEPFDNKNASVILDFDGNPGGEDNGPFVVGPGSFDVGANAGKDVWMPGERFVDVDGDGRWDGFDETNNTQDNNGDGMPDNAGPWIDLNGDGAAAPGGDDCTFLPDSDNDGYPDCCPDGPDTPGCEPFPAANACPGTQWEDPYGNDFIDCNGNLIHDAIDIATGTSQDILPYEGSGGACLPSDGDDIPDECQYENYTEACVGTAPTSPEDDCAGHTVCIEIEREVSARCEYHDANASNGMDIVEPWENFLRRWDPCYTDPDATPPVKTHWVKILDPLSGGQLAPSGQPGAFCFAGYAYAQSTILQPAEIPDPNDPNQTIPNPLFVPSYIENNYPGHYDVLESRADSREIHGQHDPLRKLAPGTCLCSYNDENGQPVPCFDVTLPDGSVLENACVAGVHATYDPSDAWTDSGTVASPLGEVFPTTKMQVRAGSSEGNAYYAITTPSPGDPTIPNSQSPGDEQWYPQVWADRYLVTDNDAPPWPQGYDPNQPAPPGGDPGQKPNSPYVQPYRDLEATNFEPSQRRYFKANFGGLWGNGTGWADELTVAFETHLTSPNSFEEVMNSPILPEEVNGPEAPGIFFDGIVEHDDMPSSKYHSEGDQRLGEITSPWRDSIPSDPDAEESAQDFMIWGDDLGRHKLGTQGPSGGDNMIPAAGPLATGIHGTMGRDAGNQLMIELLSWRTDGTGINNGIVWEDIHGMFAHPYCGPGHPMQPNENIGFRDYNLDGLIDQGEVRFPGSANYMADGYNTSPDNGVDTVYPFNRNRLQEDCIEVLDEILDFDDFIDPVTLARMTCGGGSMMASKPLQYMALDYPTTAVQPNGLVSGITLLPDGAGIHVPNGFNRSPSFIPIHNEDNQDVQDMFPIDQSKRVKMSWNLMFHNLVYALDGPGEFSGFFSATDYHIAFAAHEWLHGWEQYPDLYDYDVYGPAGPVINCPVGRWDIMATGGLVHPIPILKEGPCTEWASPVDLKTVLTPGVPTRLTLPPAEIVRDDSYYYLENEIRPGERHYFWSAGYEGFDQPGFPGFGNQNLLNGGFPGTGMLIAHTDVGSNPEALPPQQGSGTRFTYKIIQADGLGELDAGTMCGNTGDPWPGSSGNTYFSLDSHPAAEWYTQNAWTGIEITDVQPDGFGSVAIDISWTPTNIPGLMFVDPPGGVSVQTGNKNIYQARVRATDVYGGTWINLYHVDGDSDTVSIPPSGSNHVSTFHKITPGTHQIAFDWDITDLDDGQYKLVAELIPDEGADGFEASATTPRAGRNNAGDGTLEIDSVDVSKLLASGDFANVCSLAFYDSTSSTDFSAAGVTTWSGLKINGGTNVVPGIYFVWRIDAQRLAIMATDPFTGEPQNPTTGTGTARISDWEVFELVTCPQGEQDPCWAQNATISGNRGEIVSFNGFLPFPEMDFIDGLANGNSAQAGDRLMIGGIVADSRIMRSVVDVIGDSNLPNDYRTLELDSSPLVGNGPYISDIWHLVHPGTARSETWFLKCVGASGRDWQVNSTLTFPVPSDEDPNQDPYPHVTLADPEGDDIYTGTFNVAGSPVKFTITEGLVNFGLGDTFTFVTTGFTAPSRAVTVEDGQINEKPTAVINAAPLTGRAPLTVQFDGRDSFDPEGAPLTFLWTFDDGSAPASGSQVSHTFQRDGDYTVTLRVTNPDGLFGESFIDVQTINNSPNASILATPTSGPTPLTVNFSGAASSDLETPADELIYEWDFGDGETAGSGAPGAFIDVQHFYAADGEYVATLTVTDVGGKKDTATVNILSGNTRPVPNIYHTALEGPGPQWQVVFNGIQSFDAEDTPAGKILNITWIWGDGTANQVLPATGASGATDGSVPHTFTVPSGNTAGEFHVKAIIKDSEGAETTWSGVTVRVSEAYVGASDPKAIFTITPESPAIDEEITVDGHLSFDRPSSGSIAYYHWNFGDGTAATGVKAKHSYAAAGSYTVTLTVADGESPPNTNASSKLVIVTGSGGVDPTPQNEPPVPVLSYSPIENIVAGQTAVTFDASASVDPDGDDITYRWIFGDGTSSTQATTVHTFADPGSYTVRLRVTDEFNASQSATANLKVGGISDNRPPVAHITTGVRIAQPNTTLTFDGSTSFDPDGDALTFTWVITDSNGDEVPLSNANQQVLKHTFTAIGEYTIKLIVSDTFGSTSETEPQSISISAQGNNGQDPTDPGTGQPTPNPGDSSNQRPRFCGFGMVPSLFGMLMGLSVMAASRRRLRA